MTTEELLKEAHEIWGRDTISPQEVTVLLGVIYGDVCRQARCLQEGKEIDETELKKELGNIIFSTIRWCSELGYSPEECIGLAKQSQRGYVARK